MKHLFTVLSLKLLLLITPCYAATDDQVPFEDKQLEESLVHPDWFELSSGSLSDDLAEAKAEGKIGIIVYYGQKRCAYCERFMKVNLTLPDIAGYMQRNYKIIAVDIWGIEDIIDTDGNKYSERGLSIRYKTNFTPSLIFYNQQGKPAFRLRGYYPPYKFHAALRYVTENFYQTESFRDYLARAEPDLFFMQGDLIEREFFQAPPYILNKPREKALAVFFEQGKCHSCDLLHSGPLTRAEILKDLKKMDVVQLNMWSDTSVVTPQGKETTARQWADDLELFNVPTIVFFDPSGEEIIRIDSVVQFYRLWGVLDYVNRGGYKTESDYQQWRLLQRDLK